MSEFKEMDNTLKGQTQDAPRYVSCLPPVEKDVLLDHLRDIVTWFLSFLSSMMKLHLVLKLLNALILTTGKW